MEFIRVLFRSCEAPAFLSTIEGTSAVTVSADFRRRGRVGKRILPRFVDVDIKLPASLVDELRIRGIDWFRAEGAPTGAAVTYRIGNRVRPVEAFTIPERDVPDSGGVRLTGQGTAAGVRFPTAGGRAGQVPARTDRAGGGEGSVVKGR